MSNPTNFQEKLLEIARRAASLAQTRSQLPGDSTPFVEEADRLLTLMERQAEARMLQVAVVGAIKSGKSTFINALLGHDYLKRGAGVVTAMVTRVRRGQPLRAVLHFKSWPEINRELNKARVLLPDDPTAPLAEPDLRNAAHRERLQQALARLAPDAWIQEGRLNHSSLLLSAYLTGYDRAGPFIRDKNSTHTFSGTDFAIHQDFVSNDALAVYLKDVLLFVDVAGLPEGLEIADCQGSDAPNPLHLAMIQEYLLQTHLLIYVISSRTGLRQADIRFLSMLQTMGILGQTLFVVNCDLNEHASLQELQSLLDRIHSELKVLDPHSPIYAFSALYLLLSRTAADLDPRERQRLEDWQRDPALINFCDARFAAFEQILDHKLTRERFNLMVANHMERLALLLTRQIRTNHLHAELLTRNRNDIQTVIARMGTEQTQLMHLQHLLQNGVTGGLEPLRQNLRKAADSFFDTRYGAVGMAAREFIRHYQLPPDLQLQPNPAAAKLNEGFGVALYLVYQDFKQALDRFMTESINPEIVRFVRDQERHIQQHLQTLAASSQSILHDAFKAYHASLETFGLPPGDVIQPEIQAPAIGRVKDRTALTVPPMQATLEYSLQIKARSLLRLGVYKLLRMARRLFKKQPDDAPAEQRRALRDGLQQMQAALETAITAHLKDYRENIKFQYLFKLADQAAAMLLEDTQACLDAYNTNLTGLADMAENQTVDKHKLIQALTNANRQTEELLAEIRELRSQDTHTGA